MGLGACLDLIIRELRAIEEMDQRHEEMQHAAYPHWIHEVGYKQDT